jgi:3-oxoadipate enol-lactonase
MARGELFVGNSLNLPRGLRGFVVSEGERIYYETYGQGDVVVFTHGLGGNHAIWYQQVPEFTRFFRVVTWDQRGFGRSSNDANNAGPDTGVSDLTTLLDHLDINQAHLVSQSMGGWVALGFALQNPERTRTLVLGDTVAGVYTPHVEQTFNEYARKAASSPAPSELPIGQHPALGDQLKRANLAQAFLYEQIGGISGDPPRTIWPNFRKKAYSHEELKRLCIPTLFISGNEDPIFSPEIVREAASIIPGSEVKIISNTGHSPYFEAPDRWNITVIEFLESSAAKQEKR